jgi:epoxyqueuosine reductase
MNDGLLQRLEKSGLKARMVSALHVPELCERIADERKRGSFGPDFYRNYLEEFEHAGPPDTFQALSLIVVAIPQPLSRILLHINGKPFPLMIPPTYEYSGDIKVQKQLQALTRYLSCHFQKAVLPAKLLAVCSGLAEYGRNNIAYIKGLGSFFRLCVFYSDLPVEEDTWLEPRLMKACRNCEACRQNCPTEAIPSGRFDLEVERCLTYHNESRADFPSWLDDQWHHCLVGCMRCQEVCPANRRRLGWIEEKECFNDEETALLLNRTSADQWPAAIRAKLERLGLGEYYDVLSRNISKLINTVG